MGADQPATGALDVPTTALDLKATVGQNHQDRFVMHQHPRVTRRKDVAVLPQEIVDPLLAWPGGAVIGTQMETSNQRAQKHMCSVTVAEGDCMHQDGQDHASRLKEQVAIATDDVFPGGVATLCAWHGTGGDQAAVDDGGAEFFFAPHLGAYCMRKALMALSQMPARFHVWKAWDTVLPLGTSWGICRARSVRAQQVQDAIDDLTSRHGLLFPGSGIYGASMAHWASVPSGGYGFRAR